MGQQQLLLLVIGVVLVGISVMVAFNVLDKNFRQDEADGLLDRALAISTHAVYWKTKLDPFNGGEASYLGLESGGIATLSIDSTNARGRFAITAATATTLEVTGVSDRYEGIGVRVYITEYDITRSDVSFEGDFTLD